MRGRRRSVEFGTQHGGCEKLTSKHAQAAGQDNKYN